MKPHVINDKLLGVAGWYTDKNLSDRLIDLFEKNIDNTHQGMLGEMEIDKNKKDSIDLDFILYMKKYPEFNEYLDTLRLSMEEYKKLYPMCSNDHGIWGVTENFNMQKYNPGGGFKLWHAERQGGGPSLLRHLVFMTYLNDVTDQGETEWLYQNLKIKPEKGLTVIWSADWTFTHKGHTTIDEDKYIITGWFDFKK